MYVCVCVCIYIYIYTYIYMLIYTCLERAEAVVWVREDAGAASLGARYPRTEVATGHRRNAGGCQEGHGARSQASGARCGGAH